MMDSNQSSLPPHDIFTSNSTVSSIASNMSTSDIQCSKTQTSSSHHVMSSVSTPNSAINSSS